LQCVAVRCSVLQCVAVYGSGSNSRFRISSYDNFESHLFVDLMFNVVVRCSVLQCVAVCCSALQCMAVGPIHDFDFRLMTTSSLIFS